MEKLLQEMEQELQNRKGKDIIDKLHKLGYKDADILLVKDSSIITLICEEIARNNKEREFGKQYEKI